MPDFVALVSGGKDSVFNIMECIVHGYTLKAVVNLVPTCEEGSGCAIELDSYMYQSVGNEAVSLISQALQVPLFSFPITGGASCTDLNYTAKDASDEVEDLYNGLHKVITEMPSIKYVSSGAILSDYQRLRVEHVSARLGIKSLAFLWRRCTENLLDTMLGASLDVIIVKIASYGLSAKSHLGAHLRDVTDSLRELSKPPYSLNVCGEGGEYETLTLDCPIFHQRLSLQSAAHLVQHSADDQIDPVAYLRFTDLVLENKHDEQVCRSASDLLSLGEEDPCGIRPFLTPSDRLVNLPGQVREEVESYAYSVGKHIPPSFTSTESVSSASVFHRLTACSAGDIESASDSLAPLVEKVSEDLFNCLRHELADQGLNSAHVIHCQVLFNQSLTVDVCRGFDAAYAKMFAVPDENRLFPPAQVFVGADCVISPSGQMYAKTSSLAISLTATVLLPSSPTNLPPLSGGCGGLHVQSISHWAPSTSTAISQAICVPHSLDHPTGPFKWIFFSGMIGLIPETCRLPLGDDTMNLQCWLSLRHCHRIWKVFTPSMWRHLHTAICYGTSQSSLCMARAAFHEIVCSLWPLADNQITSNSCRCQTHVVWARVADLPQQAVVQWQLIGRHTLDDDNFGGTSSPIVYLNEPSTADSISRANLLFCLDEHLFSFSEHHSAVVPVRQLLFDRTEIAVAVFV